MITGFNTDIEHEGLVYHVQTEDKGLETPLILSLVYAGGAILASKRSRYEDLIASGFDEKVLSQRLRRQHRLICAAINAGRLEELKRMSARGDEEPLPTSIVSPAPVPRPTVQETQVSVETLTYDEDQTIEELAPSAEAPAGADVSTVGEAKPRPPRRRAAEMSQSPLGEMPATGTGLVLTILDDNEFRAGESFNIRVLVEDISGNRQKPLTGVSVSVKILGTTFRPQIYSVKTEPDGIATIATTMPTFTSGRAAVLIRAVANDQTTEVRRVLHPAH